jgi:hypothetical protein
MTDFSSCLAKSLTSDAMNIHSDLSDDDLSSAMGTETLLAHDLVPEGLLASSTGSAEQQIHHILGGRYLVVDQSANRRHNSKMSKIWQDGIELRALDSTERNSLSDNTIEALECLRAWWNNGLIKRP